MDQLSFCIAASGGSYQTSPLLPVFSVADRTLQPTIKHESLELAVTFGALDAVGSMLMFIPEPHCHAIGHCLSIPSRIMWFSQCCKLIQTWRQKSSK